METRVGIISDPIYLQHETGNHPENSKRILTILETLQRFDLWGPTIQSDFRSFSSRKASLEQIQWIHSASLIQQIQETSEASRISHELKWLDSDTKVSAQSFDATLHSVGGNFTAIDAIFTQEIQRAFVICRPPGHHSNRTHARGFCLFNNIALATEYLFRTKNIQRVAILDFDAHTGNGTEEIFNEGSPNGEVLHFDIHQDPRTLYPEIGLISEIGQGKQRGKIVNVPLPPGSGDSVVLQTIEEILLPIFHEFQPQFLLISAGFDGWHNDPLTNLGFSTQLYGTIIQKIIPSINQYAQGRISVSLEGGYNCVALSQGVTNVIETMANKPIRFIEADFQENEEILTRFQTKVLPELKSCLTPFWKL